MLAGCANRKKRGELTPEGREALRQTALRWKPWQSSTGPRTPEGKAQVANNGRLRQKGEVSAREIRRQLAGVNSFITELAAMRRSIQ